MARPFAAAFVAVGFACLTFGCAPSQPTTAEPTPSLATVPYTLHEPHADEPQSNFARIEPLMPVKTGVVGTGMVFDPSIASLPPVIPPVIGDKPKRDPAAVKLLEQAVEARGGKDAVKKYRCVMAKTLYRVLASSSEDTRPFIMTTYTTQSQYRSELKRDGAALPTLTIETGKEVWVKDKDDPSMLYTDLAECERRASKTMASRIRNTLAPADDAAYGLEIVSSQILHTIACPGVKITHAKLKGVVTLYFNPDTHLVMRSFDVYGNDVHINDIDEYSRLDGIQIPSRGSYTWLDQQTF